ncbi:MAG: DUF2914 domain-containing protein [Pseudomonadota bacterium]
MFGMIKHSTILFAVFVLLHASAARAESIPMCENVEGVKTKIARAIFTTKIENREPANSLEQLPDGDGRIYLFTEVRNGKDTRISHVWYRGETRIAFADLNIGSSRWRTWSRAAGSLTEGDTIHVDLVHNEQCLLARYVLPASAEEAVEKTELQEIDSPTSEATASTETVSEANETDSQPEDEKPKKLSAQDYAESVRRAALSYRNAQHAKLAGDYELAEEHLQEALNAIPESSPSRDDISDELNFRVPLLRLDSYILALDANAANNVYESILSYTEQHKDKTKLQAQLREYKLKMDAME